MLITVTLVTLGGLAFLVRTVAAVLAVSPSKKGNDYPAPQTSAN
ncbi:hypothetical protein SAMN04488564_104478 [Lentzea waywayandensis]|uniref:Uncharacterized protein n=1 Tax=Lentzea waywayandensis TaxID=84724 RepID=A0A1I6EGU6_9PSEU|nr:hypothetical protein SAMN04488564_104478 [Lentzea waywayandensis]